ncbi:MAG: histidine kinase [Actinomycetota bacterium]|nr:histidine kinase [Actinomycetota bacterium]
MLVIALNESAAGVRHPLALGLNLASLGALVLGIATRAHLGLGGGPLAALLLLVGSTAGWIGWLVGRGRDVPWLTAVSIATFGLAGGALTVFAPLALVFVGVAALGAAMAWDPHVAAWIALSGPVAMAITVAATGTSNDYLGAGAAAVIAGGAMGFSRRQSLRAAARAAETQVSEARAEAERARAELLAGRNHLARELHDVLAHTLSALSLRLEALDAVVTSGGDARRELDLVKRLVRDGLDEARGAVRALREDSPSLEDALTILARDRGAALDVSGQTRRVGPDVGLALYRVAQEALTNVVKHAPGATAKMSLVFADGSVCLAVMDEYGGVHTEADRSPLSGAGGGYGIQGIKERILLLGGRVEAGPTENGWRVHAEVPA